MNYIENDWTEFKGGTAKCIFVNSDADKNQVLNALRKHVFSHRSIWKLWIHYNGHGTVVLSHAEAAKAGEWICKSNSRLRIEDLLRVCSEKADQQPAHTFGNKLSLDITGDGCG